VLPFASTSCQTCQAGTYSVGGQIYSNWTVESLGDFSTDCTGANCQLWNVTNTFYMASGNSSGKTNTLSNLRLRAQFNAPTGNTISFVYQVDGEYCRAFFCDGLAFYIDDNQVFLMSQMLTWSTVTFSVTPGLHYFRWTYIKDYSIDYGLDAAWIQSIMLVGTRAVEQSCTSCPPGYINTADGSSNCSA